MKKVLIGILVLVILALIGYRGYKMYKKSQIKEVAVEEKIAPVEIKVVKTSPLTQSLNLTGDVKGIEEISVFPKVSGKLVEVKVKEGDRVKKEQVLAIIDRDIEGVKFELAEVTSPVEGIVGRVYLDQGARVSPPSPGPGMGTIMFRIVNMDTVVVVVNVIEKDLSKIKKGQRTKIKVDAYPEKRFNGKITLVSPTVNPMTRTASVEITIPNPRHQLRPGMFAEAEIIIKKKTEAILIPAYAILEQSEDKKVFTVVGGKAVLKVIELGIDQGDSVEVKSGLDEGDTLVVAGHHRVLGGELVRIVEGGSR
ncbi:MAG: efflux RND transporter periplasmic adaptor subunit [candidate division Zixibacteria bacterium]|nr:efflux RND transporter periplasmic adaptor subunit [candidate division Zixibacteria bacterium]